MPHQALALLVGLGLVAPAAERERGADRVVHGGLQNKSLKHQKTTEATAAAQAPQTIAVKNGSDNSLIE
jgi:hypothetical protein